MERRSGLRPAVHTERGRFRPMWSVLVLVLLHCPVVVARIAVVLVVVAVIVVIVLLVLLLLLHSCFFLSRSRAGLRVSLARFLSACACSSNAFVGRLFAGDGYSVFVERSSFSHCCNIAASSDGEHAPSIDVRRQWHL